MSIYVKIDSVPGSATASGFEEYFGAQSLNFSVMRQAEMITGDMKNRLHGKPSFGEIILTKITDDSSSALFKQSLKGEAVASAEIKIVESGPDGEPIEYAVYKLSDVIVSGFNMSAAGADGAGAPMEDVTLSYSKVETEFKGHGVDQKQTSANKVGYDLATGKIL